MARERRGGSEVNFTVAKISHERTNKERTKIDPFFDFLLHFSIYLLEILNMASQLTKTKGLSKQNFNLGLRRENIDLIFFLEFEIRYYRISNSKTAFVMFLGAGHLKIRHFSFCLGL